MDEKPIKHVFVFTPSVGVKYFWMTHRMAEANRCLKSFEILKKAIISGPLPFEIMCDASD